MKICPHITIESNSLVVSFGLGVMHCKYTITETETGTDKLAAVSNGIDVSMQHEHLHAIL